MAEDTRELGYTLAVNSVGSVRARLSTALPAHAARPDSLDVAALASAQPAKLLWLCPSPVPELVGIKLRSLELGEAAGLITLDVDGEMDRYDLVTLGLALALPEELQGHDRPLPPSRDLQLTVLVKNTLCIISSGVPLPIFWDELALERLGVEGTQLRSQLRNPLPTQTLFGLLGAFLELAAFVFDFERLLDPYDPPEALEGSLTVGPQFLRLPRYFGGRVLGSTQDVASASRWERFAHALNFLKTFDFEHLIALLPLDPCRLGSQRVAVGPASLSASWVATTPEEYEQVVCRRDDWCARGVGVDALPGLRRGEEPDDGSCFAVLGAGWALDPALELRALLGLRVSRSSYRQAFQVHGAVGGGLVALDLAGRVFLDAEAEEPFRIGGTGCLRAVDREILRCEMEVTREELRLRGMVDLVPGGPLRVTGEVEAALGARRFLLRHAVTADLAGLRLSGAELLIDHEQVCVTGTWLEQQVVLRARAEAHELVLSGEVRCQLELRVRFGAIVRGVRVADCLEFGVAGGVTLALDLRPSRGFRARATPAFELNGRQLALPAQTLSTPPADLDELGAWILEEILRQPQECFEAVFPRPGQWANLVRQIRPPSTQAGIPWLPGDSHICWRNPLRAVVEALVEGFGQARDEALRTLRSAGYVAEDLGEAASALTRGDPRAAAAALRNAGCAAGETARALAKSVTSDAAEAMEALTGAGFPGPEIPAALQEAFPGAGCELLAKVIPSVLGGTGVIPAPKLPGLGAVKLPGVGLGFGPKTAARLGDLVLQAVPHCHAPIHPPAPVPTPMPHPQVPVMIATACPTVLIGGRPAACVGDVTTPCVTLPCVPAGPGVILGGSATVMIGGRPAARAMDLTLHPTCVGPIPSPVGIVLPPGCASVVIGG